jgi:Peroxiredoxin
MNIKVGDIAPDFETLDQKGNKISLSKLRGKPVVLYFYPKDFTSGCTTEANEFKDHYDEFKKYNVEIIGVSVDSAETHKKFAEKYGLPFILGADNSKEIAKKYGVLGLATAKRVTFIIDKDGKVVYTFDKVKPKGHAQEVLEKLRELKLIN